MVNDCGEVLRGANDWQNVRSDGGVTLDVRLVLKTTDNALIRMTYRGIRQGPTDVLARQEKGEVILPANCYFRIAPPGSTISSRSESGTAVPKTLSTVFFEVL